MEPKAAEVVPKAIIKEKPAAPTLPKPTSEMIAKSRQKLEQGQFQEALKITQSPPIEQRKISEKLEQFGVGRDDVTGAKRLEPVEQARRDDAEKGANFAKKFLAGGFDIMDAAEQDMLRGQFLDAAKLRPALEQEMQGMTDAHKQAFSERYLKDPRYSKEVRRILNDALNPDKKFVDISTHQDTKEKADLDSEDAEAERTDHDRLWQANDQRLKEYEKRPSATAGMPPDEGGKWQRLNALGNEIQTAQNSIDAARLTHTSAQNELRKLQDELNTLQRYVDQRIDLPAGSRSMQTVQTEIRSATVREASSRDTVTKAEEELKAKQAEKTSINQEYDSLLQRQKALDADKRKYERAVEEKGREVTKKQWALQDAMTLRAGEEQDLADRFNSIFSEASDNILNQEIEKANTAYNEELEVLKKQTSDNNEKAMYDALQKNMLGPERIRKKGLIGFRTEERYRPISKTQVNAYHEALMTNGPEEPMKKLLTSTINQATGANYTQAEANAVLANKDFVNKMQPEVVKQILARKMLIGGISTEDIHIIVNTPWGKEMIDKAKESNDAFRTAVTADMGPNALSSPNFHEKLAEKIKKHPWWLFLILGIPFLVGGSIAGKSLENIGK